MSKIVTVLCAAALVSGPALAQNLQPASQPDRKSPTAFNNPIPNIAGKSIMALVVDYPPGGGTPAHRHAPSAFITGYVLQGAVRSQVDNGPAKVYRAGEYFTENPGSHHVVSENASKTEPAKMLAIFVLDTGDAPLSTPDK
jgi:quercetin dioxygenase-like cupin family protein